MTSWGKRYSSSLPAAPLHRGAGTASRLGLALPPAQRLRRKAVGKWPWTTQRLECSCFVVLCDEGTCRLQKASPCGLRA